MSRRVRWLALAAAVTTAVLGLWWMSLREAAPLAAQTAEPRPMVRRETVVFARPGEVPLSMDLCLPGSGEGPFPAVVCLHGGGWVGGGRAQMTRTIEVLARRGYVAAAPDYRLAPKHPFPACAEDCKAAVRWLRANAGTYRINPERIGATGLSAGAHLACLLGVTDSGDGLDGTGGNGERSGQVQAVVAFSTPTDLTDESLWTKETVAGNLTPLLGGPPREKMDLCRRASPLRYSPRAPAPLLLVHGGQDKVVPARQAQALAEQVRRCGGKADVVILEGEGHTWSGPALIESIDRMLGFLDETLK